MRSLRSDRSEKGGVGSAGLGQQSLFQTSLVSRNDSGRTRLGLLIPIKIGRVIVRKVESSDLKARLA